MPSLVASKTHVAPSVMETGATAAHSSRGAAAGVYALQLRRKLLQQQLGVVEEKCKRVAKVVAKKHLTKQLSRHDGDTSNLGGESKEPVCSVGRREDAADRVNRGGDRRRRTISYPGGLPAIGVGGAGATRSGREHHNSTLKERGLTNKPACDDRRNADLLTAAPFKKGGCIDHANKKHMLRDKRREIDREAELEKNRRPTRRAVNVRGEVAVVPSAFPDRYLRGEVPCSKHCSAANALVWVCPLNQLDYDYYLPMFFDGIRCLEDPLKVLARQGVCDLLSAARGSPQRILPSLPAIVRAIRVAISCKNPELLVFVCTALRELATGNKEVGEALVGYYKMFLHVFNLFMNSTKSTGDKMDYGQRNSQDVGEAISLTIETLERNGGKLAFAHIKQCVPTYQTCIF